MTCMVTSVIQTQDYFECHLLPTGNVHIAAMYIQYMFHSYHVHSMYILGLEFLWEFMH